MKWAQEIVAAQGKVAIGWHDVAAVRELWQIDRFDLSVFRRHRRGHVRMVGAMSTTEQDEWKTFAAVIRDDPRAAQLQMLVEGALAEGRRQGWSDAALEVLDARHIAVSDEIRDHILGCGDTDMLRLWVRRSVTATTAAATALFDEPKLSAGVGDLERAGGRDLRPGGPSAGRPTDSSMPPTQLPRRARL